MIDIPRAIERPAVSTRHTIVRVVVAAPNLGKTRVVVRAAAGVLVNCLQFKQAFPRSINWCTMAAAFRSVLPNRRPRCAPFPPQKHGPGRLADTAPRPPGLRCFASTTYHRALYQPHLVAITSTGTATPSAAGSRGPARAVPVAELAAAAVAEPAASANGVEQAYRNLLERLAQQHLQAHPEDADKWVHHHAGRAISPLSAAFDISLQPASIACRTCGNKRMLPAPCMLVSTHSPAMHASP